MTIAKAILASAAAITIINSGALAAMDQVSQGGQITKVDAPNGKITIEYMQSGGPGTVTADFKAKESLSFNTYHAGDKVGFTAEKIDGTWTIIAIQKQ
jgi:Cu(I)/Ag(I) efflux system protein CusF